MFRHMRRILATRGGVARAVAASSLVDARRAPSTRRPSRTTLAGLTEVSRLALSLGAVARRPEGLVPAPTAAVSRGGLRYAGSASGLAAGHLQGPARTVSQTDHLLSLVLTRLANAGDATGQSAGLDGPALSEMTVAHFALGVA